MRYLHKNRVTAVQASSVQLIRGTQFVRYERALRMTVKVTDNR